MVRKNIGQQELLDAVIQYESDVRLTNFVGETEVKFIYRFKAQRREKLVIVLPVGQLQAKQEELISEAGRLIMDDASLSDNVDLYTTGIVTEKRAEELELPLRKQGLSVSFFDAAKIENTPQFASLMDAEPITESESEIDPAFFDYLALSNDSTDIKNGFFYSILLMEVYRHQPVTEEDFFEICQNKYSRQQSDIKIALRNLRKKEKITPLRKGGVFSLTEEEERNLQNAIRESKSEEANFKEGLESIVVRYGLHEATRIYEKLKADYIAKYSFFSRDDDREDRKRGCKSRTWDDVLTDMNEEAKISMLEELKQLCSTNDYMDQYGLIHSFLDLFRSERYEGYINQKENMVYLDTPLVVHYICAKSSYKDDYEIEWNNAEHMSANDLFGYGEEQKESIKFVIPHDYLQEALGELKKALQFNWFSQFKDLPIPVETANVFYNYYLEVKRRKELYDEDAESFTFDEFAETLGFTELNPESLSFFPHNIGYLRFFFNKLGCLSLDKVDVNHSIFDEVKMDYVWYLHDQDKVKTELAINADVRQSMHITEESQDVENGVREYYLVSWDNTLYHLRDKTKEMMEVAGRSFNIYKPSELAEKLAFRNFRISKESVSNEVFAYANSTYNVKDKIRSLYDNVLNPYFASFGKSNCSLVLEVLKMQKANMEGGEGASPRDDKTALENIFLTIIAELPKQNCSTQNLKDYLNDSENNAVVIPLFSEAFDEYKKGNKVNIAKRVCELVKTYVSKDEKEVRL